LIKSLQENKKYGAKRLLKMFPNKNWSLGKLKALIKKLTTQVDLLLFDILGSGLVVDLALSAQYSTCVVNFLISTFSLPRLPFLLRNILSNRFAPYFLFSYTDLIKYLPSGKLLFSVPVDGK